MAKVTGPLFSVSASGKLAQALVYGNWKGSNTVRELVTPSNPQTTGQGDARLILGGLGRACKVIDTNSQMAVDTREVTAAGNTWVNKIVKYLRDTYMPTAAAFETLWTEATGHAQWGKFDSEAASLGLTTFNITYKGTSNQFIYGLQLYMLAKFGCDQYTLDNTKFNREPWLDTIGSWVGADIDAMVALLPSL